MEKIDRRDRLVKGIEKTAGEEVHFRQDLGNKYAYYNKEHQFVTYVEKETNVVSVTELQTVMTDKNGMSYGILVPKYSPTAINYLNEVRDFNDTTAGIKKQIQLSNKLYLWEGIVATVINVMCEFATTSIKIKNVKNEKAKKILNYFIQELNASNKSSIKGIQPLARQMMMDWFLSGNVFPYKCWEAVKDPRMSDTKKATLPLSIYLLNPINIEIPEGYVEFGQKLIYLRLSEKVVSALTTNSKYLSKEQKAIREMAPKDLIKKLEGDLVLLDSDLVTHLMRKGRDYLPWGIPFLTSAFGACAFKRKLKALDESTSDGLINQITIFKIGDKDNPKTWDPNRISAFSRLISSPTSSLTMVWAYDIDLLRSGPEGDVLNFKDKYAQANIDILNALGIPVSLISGAPIAQTGAGDLYAQILPLLERLEEPRDIIRSYFNEVFREIMVENGFKDEYPEMDWQNTRLRNEKEVKNLVLAFYDRGLLSIRTALEEAGYNFDRETDIREKENKDKLEETYQRRDLPFGTPKDQMGGQGRPTGKPPTTKTTPKTKTFNKPSVKAEVEIWGEIVNKFFSEVDNIVSEAKDQEDIALLLNFKLPKLENALFSLSEHLQANSENLNTFREKENSVIATIRDNYPEIDQDLLLGCKKELLDLGLVFINKGENS